MSARRAIAVLLTVALASVSLAPVKTDDAAQGHSSPTALAATVSPPAGTPTPGDQAQPAAAGGSDTPTPGTAPSPIPATAPPPTEAPAPVQTAPPPTLAPTAAPTEVPTAAPTQNSSCSPAYPDFCIPPPPPDLDCPDIGRHNFTVLPPDPHHFDGDHDGIGCES